jgi:hypothetical protein
VSSLREREERRDKSLTGAWNRAQFNLSLKSLDTFGFPAHIVEYCRDRGRATGRLPHEVVIEIVEIGILHATHTP